MPPPPSPLMRSIARLVLQAAFRSRICIYLVVIFGSWWDVCCVLQSGCRCTPKAREWAPKLPAHLTASGNLEHSAWMLCFSLILS